jgi:hypothetical protein
MRYIVILLVVTITGCGNLSLPSTVGEQMGAATYVPLDPLPTQTLMSASCDVSDKEIEYRNIDKVFVESLRNSLPDHTVRLSVAEFDASGTLNYGPASIGVKGNTYKVIIDYMNTDTVKGSFLVKRTVIGQNTSRPFRWGEYSYPMYPVGKVVGIYEKLPSTVFTNYKVLPNPNDGIFSTAFFGIEKENIKSVTDKFIADDYEVINIPVYVGVGTRMTATVTVKSAEVSLSGLPEIAAEARAGNLVGSMIVQTLGATGDMVGTNLPLPSELDRSTIQSAILSVGSIKTLMAGDDLFLRPRVVGIYNTIGGGSSFVNGIISALATDRISWHQPCGYTYKKN